MRIFLSNLITAAIVVAGFLIYSSYGTDRSKIATPASPETAPESEVVPASADMTSAERATLRKEVRAYLLDQPEVLMEAIAVLEGRQRTEKAQSDKSMIQSNADALFSDGYSWVGGNPEGDVTLVEFRDYRCGYCRKAHPEVAELLESDGNIRLIIKEFPILGEQSTISSKLAVATLLKAGPQAYEQVAEFLITFNGTLSENAMRTILQKFSIEADPVLAELDSPEVTERIASTRALGSALKISGTPTFVLGDEMLRGYVPLDGMREIVASIRADGG
ncbi:MAG: DsbA family protein [Paracoccaceae bacterium]